MINFHVTNWIFERVKNGDKLHEYREYKPYWINRFSNVNPPLMANIVRSYTKDKIPIVITKKTLINKNDIQERSYRDFINTEQCYDIEYRIAKGLIGVKK